MWKRTISAFSDDLLKDNAMLTAIKEIRDFTEQIHGEILHKNSFMLYYIDAGFKEYERIGIVTKSFEREKFRAVAAQLEQLFKTENAKVSDLVANKMKTNLVPYMREVGKIRDFADKRLRISGKVYELHVFLLEEVNSLEAAAAIQIDTVNNFTP